MADLGYVFRKAANDWIKKDLNGRFHAKLKDGKYSIHYDFIGPEGNHITNIPMPLTIRGEQSRIGKYLTAMRRKAVENSSMETHKP